MSVFENSVSVLSADPIRQHGADRGEGARVAIRGLVATDLPRLREIWNDPEVMRYMAHPPMTAQQAAEAFDRLLRPDEYVLRSYRFAVVRRADDVLVGTIGMDLERFSCAYAHSMYMHRETWGVGIATEALGLLVRFGFEELGAHRVWAACGTRNEGAKRLLQRVGFTWVGTIREYYPQAQAWCDAESYSYLGHEWRAHGQLLRTGNGHGSARS